MVRVSSMAMATLAVIALAFAAAGASRASEDADIEATEIRASEVSVAVVILREPVPVEAAVALTRAAGVRVEQVHREYLGGASPVTTGIAVGPAERFDAAIARYAASEASWFRYRLAQFAELTQRVDPARRQMIEQAEADVIAARGDFRQNGLRADRLIVRGSIEAIQYLREHPSVAAVHVR